MDNKDPRLEEVYKVAGDSLSKVLDAYFPDKKELANWFYNPNNKRLGNSPHDFCKEGKQGQLESLLIDLATGNLG